MNHFNKTCRSTVSIYITLSLLINLIIELLGHKTFASFLDYILHSPLVFIFNSLIILATLSICILFRRRIFIFSIISGIWIGFGVTNRIILSNRVTPFTANDFKLIKAGLDVAGTYFSVFEIFLLIVGILGVVSLFIYIWINSPKIKTPINYSKNFLIVLSLSIFVFSSSKVLIKFNVLSDYFGNIAFAYLDYGFPYCFTNSLINSGIDRPSNYSKATIDSILNTSINVPSDIHLASNSSSISLKDYSSYPNIIMIQLESFFDPTLLKKISFSEDPIPTFRSLKDTFSSGYLNVPSVGAGTANTEFEILTGMSLDFFGPGEYPYKTILKETTAESISYNLKDNNYNTHAIHNNTGTFYDRDFIFSQLGFDSYTSVEYMSNVKENDIGWTKDDILTEEILKSLNSSVEKDFIYTITVQSHGAYPQEEILNNPKITVSGIEDEGLKNSYTYYVNQLNEVDTFIKNLLAELSTINENTVVVLFGDHLPTLGINDEDLINNSTFQTEYVVWNNFNLPVKNENMEAYQLSSSILNRVGITDGILNKFHNNSKDTSNYLENLELLQYDMLYGERYVFNGNNPYIASNLKMGIDKIYITDAYIANDLLYIKGNNFNSSSAIFINDNKIDTTYINSSFLKSTDSISLQDDDIITIKQINKSDTILSSTETYKY